MSTAIGELLPLAVAISISVSTIITTVLMLLSPKAKSRTVGLLVGYVVGVAGAGALFALLPVVLALRQWRGRPAEGDHVELPRWMAGLDSMMPGKALVLGLLLSAVVPKNLLIALAAGVIVGEAGLSIGQASVVIVGFTAIATSTVAVPVIANFVAPSQTRGPFETLREWLLQNNVTIMVLVVFVIGVVMIGNGVASL